MTPPTAGFQRHPTEARRLNAEDLGLVAHEADASGPRADVDIADDDPILLTTRDLLRSFGGVIYVGPPGTSKSHYAQNVGLKLAGLQSDLVRYVQFHPSYQYEDFIEGYVPTGTGSFELIDKHLLEMCNKAETHPDELVVLVIDELSRGEPGRVFGEALTYVEKSKRGLPFHLASGKEASIPENLIFLCTMNPMDRGVDEVDAAFERRFAKIAMEPDIDILEAFLVAADMAETLRGRVRNFFQWANAPTRGNPLGVGHTFFLDISDEDGLRRLWDHQLRFLFEKAYQLDPDGLRDVKARWRRIFQAAPEPGGADVAEEVAAVGDVEAGVGDAEADSL